MARIVNEAAHTGRRNAILDAAQRLIYTKGYEQMTIQDILDDLEMSKGAFYHYFGSKPALLEALTERLIQEAEHVMLPIVHNPYLSALEKFQRLFPTISRWKTDQKSYLLALMPLYLSDDNAIFRQKARARGAKMMAPLLDEVIRQGIAEGVLRTAYPDQIGGVVFSLVMSLSDALIEILLADQPQPNGITPSQARVFERTIAAYADAIERVLGAPAGTLPFIDVETLKAWEVSDST